MLTIDRMSVVVDMFLLSVHYFFLVSYVTLSIRVFLKVPCFSQSHSYNTCPKKHAASETYHVLTITASVSTYKL